PGRGAGPGAMAAGSREQSLREELTCAICWELFSQPVMLDCMHHFCKACIQRYWASGPRVASCPQCRRQFPQPAFRTHYLLAGLVDKVRRCGSQEHRRKVQVSPGDSSSRRWFRAGKSRAQGFLSPAASVRHLCLVSGMNCQTHLLPLASAQKASGELNFKIRAEFTRLHQILEDEERAVLAELGAEEEQVLARLHGDMRRLEEGMAALRGDKEHIEETLGKMEEVSLLEVSVLGWPWQEVVEWSLFVQLHELQTMTANSLCSSLQVESLDIRYVSGMKEADFSAYLSPAPLTFDPESAHPNLVFSRDLTAVTERERAQPVPRSPRRFQQSVNVLASRTFNSGQHYWEVWVGRKTKWDLGVAAEAVDRAAKVKLCPENGYWTLRLRNRTEYWATATPWVRLAPQRPPRRVGVFLDCQEGTVAFFDARDMSHLFTFHQVSAERYCPFFSTCFSDGRDNVEPMRLCHLAL
ncbi:A33 protein, partial [Alectura lathami]|nr:A33 protein [Alectura lathami]